MNVLVVLSVISLCIGYVLAQGDVVHLETRGRPYRANFTYKVYDILKVPYATAANSFKSEVFATENNKDVKWYFNVTLHPKVEVALYVSSLPSNVNRISGVSEIGEIDVNGLKRVFSKNRTSVATGDLLVNFGYKNRSSLENNPTSFPNGHWTVFFDIDAILVYDLNITDGVMPTKVIKPTSSLECRQQMVRDNLHMLSLLNGTFRPDVQLGYSSGGSQKIESYTAILTSRLPLLKLNDEYSTYYDFGYKLAPEELEDLVSFISFGTMNHWNQSCFALYSVARKYGVKCLQETCMDALMGQLKDLNA